MRHPISPYAYEQLVRGLPRPSAAQCAAFLDHLAARPWTLFLPADDGVPLTLFLNPLAGRDANAGAPASPGQAAEAEHYRAAFGHLDYASPVACGPAVLAAAGVAGAAPGRAAYYVLDDAGRAVPLPGSLCAAATATLSAAIHPDPTLLLETLPLRVPQVFDPGADRLAPLQGDAELRDFAEQYTREELGGFLCASDREAWESRWLGVFQPLYAPRHARQRAALERALDGLLAWLDGVDKG